MKTPRAHRKLQEARFFLARLREEAERESFAEAEAFGFYLSAFLTATDAVIDVASREVSVSNEAFGEWRMSLDEEEAELLHFMTGQRNKEVHGKGAKTTVRSREIAKTFALDVQLLDWKELSRGRTESGPNWIRVWIPVRERHFVKTPNETAPVLALCNRYFELAERFLSWAEGGR